MKKSSLIRIGLMVVAVVATVAVYQRSHTAGDKPGNGGQHVTLAMDWTPNTNHTGIYVALTKSWYKDQGIDLDILPYSAQVTATNLVSNNKADIGIGSTEDIVGENAKNHLVVSIGALVQHNTSGLMVRADSGINRPKDLDGKVYGGYGSPLEGSVVSQVIKKDGGEGTFQNITLSVGAIQALESNKIDAVWAFEGWELLQAKRDGLTTKFFPITSYGIPDGPNLAFIATRKSTQEKTAMLTRFMAATAKGYEYARKHPQESAQILINATPKETFPDKQLVVESQTFLSKHYADTGHAWGTQSLESWTNYPRFMLQSGNVTDDKGKPVNKLPYDKLFTNQFLPK